MKKILAMLGSIEDSAQRLAATKTYWAAVGSGPNKASADEIRIKLSELCYKTISSDFVEDKKHGNANLGTIYPTIGGSADTIRSLKMQRLNVGFSRAKDTMVFVHSMPIEDYSNTRLGEACLDFEG